MTGRPFTIHVPDAAIEDLKTRLRGIRWPDSLDDESWDDGAALAFVRRLADHWLHRFDWRPGRAAEPPPARHHEDIRAFFRPLRS